MKLLLTGASSFTGAWFARTLRCAGHEVVATLQGDEESYSGTRAARLKLLREAGVELVPQCSFGGEKFLSTLNQGFDILCHHGANVTNYKSPDFDVSAAVQDNTRNVRAVLEQGHSSGLKGVVLTGSVFEQDEGAGNAPMRAFSPYGLSKGLSWEVFRYWATVLAVPLHKFVIPNPFGPHEEPRFCAYLMQKWAKGEVAQVNTPSYVRDNIHVSLLALAYADLVQGAASSAEWKRLNPSGYAETQGAFATRFAREIGSRLGLAAELAFGVQTDFSEPFTRINTDRVDASRLGWNEAAAWDELAGYYLATYLRP